MRFGIYAMVGMLALAIVPGVASATLSHDECGSSWKTVGNGAASVEIWRGPCLGVVVWAPSIAQCADNDQHVPPVHALVLHSDGCQTGVLVGAA